MEAIISAAYLSGYEPSRDDLSREELFEEARYFLSDLAKAIY